MCSMQTQMCPLGIFFEYCSNYSTVEYLASFVKIVYICLDVIGKPKITQIQRETYCFY